MNEQKIFIRDINMTGYTIRDIARMVGVSTGTVSRVLNNASNVDPEIYQRTMSIIKKTNYKPGSKGRKPGSKNGGNNNKIDNTLAVISAEMSREWETNTLWTSYMNGVEKACRERGYHMIMYFGNSEKTNQQIVADLKTRCSGCLWKNVANTPEYFDELCHEIPVVGFGAYNPLHSIPQVALDDYAAGVIATEKLIKMGHSRIVFVNTELHHMMFVNRSQGFITAMKQHGLYEDSLLIEGEFFQPEELKQPQKTPPDMDMLVDMLSKISPAPTAVIFPNDWIASGFYRACAKHKINLPDDISVVGMDDVGSMCELLVPRLTSVAMPFSNVAYFAAMKLIDMISGMGGHEQGIGSVQYLSGKFNHRDSTKNLIKKQTATKQ